MSNQYEKGGQERTGMLTASDFVHLHAHTEFSR